MARLNGLPPMKTFLRVMKIVSTRLRFLVVFALAFVIIGGWETIRTYWARMTSSATSEQATSSDTEYFCPMDPGVLSDWPSKCPICNMTLVRRKKGESTALPDGVIARMQFSPYRLWLGGIQTSMVDYFPLLQTIEAPGTVITADSRRCLVEAEVFASEIRWIEAGYSVEVSGLVDRSASAWKGRVLESKKSSAEQSHLSRIVVEIETGHLLPQTGDRVRVRVHCPAEHIEPFRSQPSTPPALRVGEPRKIYACMEHSDIVRDAPGKCPRDQSELMARSLRLNQRIRWWCPMHPAVTAEQQGAKCADCGGMVLEPRVISFRLPGTVLTVPCSAVIDDGSRACVYVEHGQGMFDGTLVTLGPRCGESFPVIAGLEPGDRIVTQGAFLIDAETRLNPSLAASYFGAGDRGSKSLPGGSSSESDGLHELNEIDRPLALRQKICPVTGKPLGSMGTPLKLEVKGRHVFICCEGCTSAMLKSPDKYFAKLPDADGEKHP